VVVAVPAAVFAALIIWQGGWIFAAGVGLLAVICIHELSVMFERARPVRLAAMVAVLGLTAAGTIGDERTVLMVFMATLPVTFFLAVAMPQRERVSASISVTVLMIMWIGLGVAHAALLRGLDHGGALVLMVLLGTFFGDTFAYFGGRLFGRH
jgi:phosphatidate cytidylyltransferase